MDNRGRAIHTQANMHHTVAFACDCAMANHQAWFQGVEM